MNNTKNTPLNWKQVEELPLGFNPTSTLPNRNKRRFLDKEPKLGNNRKNTLGRRRQYIAENPEHEEIVSVMPFKVEIIPAKKARRIWHKRKDLTIKLG